MSDYFDRVEQQLVRAVERGSPRASRLQLSVERVALVACLLVVVVVGGIFVATRGRSTSGSEVSAAPVEVVFTASGPVPRSDLVRTLDRAVPTLGLRIASAFRDAEVGRKGREIVVTVPAASHPTRARIVALAAFGQLEFFDWEANVLTARGAPVASNLRAQAPDALTVSQGSGSAAPGEPGAGGMNLYDAVRLAARQPANLSYDNSRLWSQYYLFGAPGSAACATAAKDLGRAAAPGVHCLLAGPADSRRALMSGLPAGVTGGEELVIRRGTAVIQAADSRPGRPIGFTDPNARFYVVKDHVPLFGTSLRSPQAGNDQGGNPDVSFSFNAHGEEVFQQVTAELARRGNRVSRPGEILNQHFAVVLDGKLLTVPQIDFKTYPEGIHPGHGADIVGAFTAQGAHDLAAILRSGPLPVMLTPR